MDYLTTDHGDAISIMERHPEIKGSFDIVLSQNLIHYLSPKNYSQFIKTAYDLLIPGGKLYLTGQHIYTYISMSYSGYLAQLPNKKQFIQDMTQ